MATKTINIPELWNNFEENEGKEMYITIENGLKVTMFSKLKEVNMYNEFLYLDFDNNSLNIPLTEIENIDHEYITKTTFIQSILITTKTGTIKFDFLK